MFDFGFEQDGPTKMYEDLRAVIDMSLNPVNRKASRHIHIRKHFIGALVQEKLLIWQCPVDKMVTGVLTKGVPAAPAFLK